MILLVGEFIFWASCRDETLTRQVRVYESTTIRCAAQDDLKWSAICVIFPPEVGKGKSASVLYTLNMHSRHGDIVMEKISDLD